MIRFFKDTTKQDVAQVGGKAANLGELFSGFSVPNGFVLTTDVYNDFVAPTKQDILVTVNEIDLENVEELETVAQNIKKQIMSQQTSEKLVLEVEQALAQLNGDLFAVRSSATAEDLKTASFAGQQDTLLNVKKENIIDAIKQCWASVFNARAIQYRNEKNIAHDAAMAVIVQEMINPDYAGVAFTVDPIEQKFVLVEIAPGLGEKVVSGAVTPSSFMLDPTTFDVKQEHTEYQIDVELVKKIARCAKDIEQCMNAPQDIEFALKGGNLFILQSRPITTL